MGRSTKSGLEETPAVCATTSPMERDMARPGRSRWPSQTRGGPSTPSSYSTAKTRPPAATMRFFSSGRSGLWSVERATAPAAVPRVTRESPTLATRRTPSRRQQKTSVVPLNSVSTAASSTSSRSRLAMASSMARRIPGRPSGQSGWPKTRWQKFFLKKSETTSPASPWPSRTRIACVRVATSSTSSSASWFFFRGLYGEYPFREVPQIRATWPSPSRIAPVTTSRSPSPSRSRRSRPSNVGDVVDRFDDDDDDISSEAIPPPHSLTAPPLDHDDDASSTPPRCRRDASPRTVRGLPYTNAAHAAEASPAHCRGRSRR
mmetsp:Transcript_13327/g.42120  ORF Transcript_13327/g.42120 Transcript_13327/m.42120 type:complete len:318 (-) Transcript_13327:59-1012(-)